LSVAAALVLWSSTVGCGSPAGAPADAAAAPSVQYDLGGQFSLSANPNGAWQYGYATTPDPAGAVALDTEPADLNPIGFWHPTDSSYYPYVAGNLGASSTTDSSGSWALRPGQIAMEASADGLYSIVQFVAPAAGSYEVQASSAGVHFRHSTTDAHILVGATHLLDADIDGYGGDPAFHALDGQSPQATYEGTLTLAAGDAVRFALGPGADGTNANDTTALQVLITARE